MSHLVLAKIWTLATRSVFAAGYAGIWCQSLLKNGGVPTPSLPEIITGLVTDFFDTLGIGSFATTTSVFKFTGVVDDELIPGTLHVGHTLPVILQAFIYISVIEVDPVTLVLMIASATIGAWFGAGRVAGLPQRHLRIGVACALLVAFLAMLASQRELYPAGGATLGLSGGKLVFAVAANALIGAISTLGIGIYAPSMTLVSLLGDESGGGVSDHDGLGGVPDAGGQYPFRTPRSLLAASRAGAHLRSFGGRADCRVSRAVAALDAVRWLVRLIVLYAAQAMLRSAFQSIWFRPPSESIYQRACPNSLKPNTWSAVCASRV